MVSDVLAARLLRGRQLTVGVHMDAQEILEIEQIMDEDTGLELTEDNIETVLDEIRPYLVGEPMFSPFDFCSRPDFCSLQSGDAASVLLDRRRLHETALEMYSATAFLSSSLW